MKGLWSRNGVWHVRIGIPEDVRHAFGGKREFLQSLRTRDKHEALRLGGPIVASVHARIAAARRASPTVPPASGVPPQPLVSAPPPAPLAVIDPRKLERAIAVWRDQEIERAYIDHANGLAVQPAPFGEEAIARSERVYALQQGEWAKIADFDAHYAAALAQAGVEIAPAHPLLAKTRSWFGTAWLEVERMTERFRAGDLSWAPPSAAVAAGGAPAEAAAAGPTGAGTSDDPQRLTELLERYLKKHEPAEPKRLRTYVRRLSEFLGDPPLRDIRTQHLDDFLVELRRFPNSKRPDIEALPFPQVIARFGDDPAMRRLTEQTIWSNWFVFFKALFQFAVDRGWLSANPVTHAMPRKPKGHANKRETYTAEEIAHIFTQPMFQGCKSATNAAGKAWGYRSEPGAQIHKDACYWLPIVALWTGCRVEEIAAARAADVKCEDGVWLLDLRERTDLKNDDAAPRPVPLHARLIATGFVKYAQRQAAGAFLFPELPHDPDNAEASSRMFTKWWGRWCDANGLPDPSLVFHSFRHTFKQACRDAFLPEDLHDALTGHKGGSAGRGYGGHTLATLNEGLNKVAFPTFPSTL
jgi:integrase